jgi:hypothetical protein
MRRAKSLRIGVHHADAVVWGPVYRTRLRDEEIARDDELLGGDDALLRERGLGHRRHELLRDALRRDDDGERERERE